MKNRPFIHREIQLLRVPEQRKEHFAVDPHGMRGYARSVAVIEQVGIPGDPGIPVVLHGAEHDQLPVDRQTAEMLFKLAVEGFVQDNVVVEDQDALVIPADGLFQD